MFKTMYMYYKERHRDPYSFYIHSNGDLYLYLASSFYMVKRTSPNYKGWDLIDRSYRISRARFERDLPLNRTSKNEIREYYRIVKNKRGNRYRHYSSLLNESLGV